MIEPNAAFRRPPGIIAAAGKVAVAAVAAVVAVVESRFRTVEPYFPKRNNEPEQP